MKTVVSSCWTLLSYWFAHFDKASCHVKGAHMARSRGWPPVNSQQGTEALWSTVHEEWNPDNQPTNEWTWKWVLLPMNGDPNVCGPSSDLIITLIRDPEVEDSVKACLDSHSQKLWDKLFEITKIWGNYCLARENNTCIVLFPVLKTKITTDK